MLELELALELGLQHTAFELHHPYSELEVAVAAVVGAAGLQANPTVS